MKKWFTILLVPLMLMACCGSTFAKAEENAHETVTFEAFCSDAGLAYVGEWICFDEALYVYLPAELTEEEITEEMQAEGVLAHYSSTDGQGITYQIQLSKRGKKDSIEAIQVEVQGFCAQTVCITVNEIPVVAAYSGSELYAEVLMENGEAYLMKVGIASDHKEMGISSAQGMYMYEMLYSISAMPLKIDEEKVNNDAHQMEQEEDAVCEKAPVRMSSEIKIQFEYNDSNIEDLDQINQMLATMELTDVDVEDLSVYLSTTQELDHEVVVDTAYRCGLNRGILVCRKADFKKAYRYQLATEVFEAGAMEDEAFENYWCEQYPDRRLSTIATYRFETHTAFVVVYFEEISK